MIFFSKEQLETVLDYPSLVGALQKAFKEEYTVPLRHHHEYFNPQEASTSTLLIMPAWQVGAFLGVKIATVSPHNSQYGLPSIHGIYILFDASKGIPLAQMEAKTLTNLRTAAASALASTFLSRPDSKQLLMIGTGALAPCLIKAHAAVRPITHVFLWGRNFSKAKKLAEKMRKEPFEVIPIPQIDPVISKVDIISCATLSNQALVFGKDLKPGQHLDLVGSYRPDMREADDEAVKRASIFVDNFKGAPKESGDIAIPLQEGLIQMNDIYADLFCLCRKQHPGRISRDEITLFKSVGHALEDIAAAQLAFSRLNSPGVTLVSQVTSI